MPELPEVEILRRYFDEAVLNLKIVDTRYLDERNKIFRSSRQEIGSNLIGNSFTETQRVGKYLFARISNGKWLHLHFGMTGSLEIFNDEAAMPRFTRFAIIFEDGTRLAFRDSRKFGVVEIVDDPETYRSNNSIGQDLLKLKKQDFVKSLRGRQTPVKSALLSQRHFAGIGNWIADEMLFECGIHPETQPDKLSDEQLGCLYDSAVKIVKEAIDKDTHYGDFPAHFFVNYRKKGARHPNHPNSPVEKLKVGGRGSFIVPEKQKKA